VEYQLIARSVDTKVPLSNRDPSPLSPIQLKPLKIFTKTTPTNPVEYKTSQRNLNHDIRTNPRTIFKSLEIALIRYIPKG